MNPKLNLKRIFHAIQYSKIWRGKINVEKLYTKNMLHDRPIYDEAKQCLISVSLYMHYVYKYCYNFFYL